MKSLLIFALLALSVFSWQEVNFYSPQKIDNQLIGATSFNKEGTQVYMGTSSGQILVYDTNNPYKKKNTIPLFNNQEQQSKIVDIKLQKNGNGNQKLAICAGKSVHILDAKTKRIIANISLPNRQQCSDVQWSQNGQRIYVTGKNSGRVPQRTIIQTSNYAINSAPFPLDFAEDSKVQDSDISTNQNCYVVSGQLTNNLTSSTVLVYCKKGNQWVQTPFQVPIRPQIDQNGIKKRVMFIQNGNKLLVYGVGTKYAQIFQRKVVNGVTTWVLWKDLQFDENIKDIVQGKNGQLWVLTQNDKTSYVQLIDYTKSDKNKNYKVIQKIDTGKKDSKKLHISPKQNQIIVRYRDNKGVKLFRKPKNSKIYAPVIGAVVGSIVVASVLSVIIASIISPIAGAAAAGAGTVGGIIGTQAAVCATNAVPATTQACLTPNTNFIQFKSMM